MMSRNELVAAFEQRLGRRIRRQRIPGLVMRALSIALRPVHPGLASVMGMGIQSDSRDSAPDDHVFRELGIEPRPVSAYIEELTTASLRQAVQRSTPAPRR
jgi:hypothetical protein